ncbi:MAG: helix-turn-helix domain-containing protein [Desulfobulbaceae bacterium]|nr:helix-turn-helix domain-containing protein [Desulfobulbaceae bacterium]
MVKKTFSESLPLSVANALLETGEFIACARKERRWSQEELARRVGVGRMTIMRMEKGAPEVAAGHYLTAAWVLGLPLLTWQIIGDERVGTTVGDLLSKLKRNLPQRVRKKRKQVDNDF